MTELERAIEVATERVTRLKEAGIEKDPYWPPQLTIEQMWAFSAARTLGRLEGRVELLDYPDAESVEAIKDWLVTHPNPMSDSHAV